MVIVVITIYVNGSQPLWTCDALDNFCGLSGTQIQILLYILQCLSPCRGAEQSGFVWAGTSLRLYPHTSLRLYPYTSPRYNLDDILIPRLSPHTLRHSSWESLVNMIAQNSAYFC